jgi:outer membrane protein OmpA-like peptidoglycan-associated protein
MKKLISLLLPCFLCSLVAPAQMMKKLGDKVKQSVDKTADKLLTDDKQKKTATTPTAEATSAKAGEKPDATDNLAQYASYDFVPGDSALFVDDNATDEVNEIPARWILDKGRAEVNEVAADRMIAARAGTTLRPRMKNMDNYLPARFTIEFDMKHVSYNPGYGRSVVLRFANPSADKNQDAGAYGSNYLAIWASGEANFAQAKGEWPYPRFDAGTVAVMKEWKHVAISVNEKSVKVYVNQFRILNAQVEWGKPSSLVFTIDNDYEAPVLIKNFRIMAGGKSPAKQVTTNNLYIARGILFERASATLLPESMGELNVLVKLMKDDPALKFEIGGHTSAEAGSSAEANQLLSEQRANTVREKMIGMGIAADRLTAKGYGQTKPIGSNDTPEGRATNRRVEFVKK